MTVGATCDLNGMGPTGRGRFPVLFRVAPRTVLARDTPSSLSFPNTLMLVYHNLVGAKVGGNLEAPSLLTTQGS